MNDERKGYLYSLWTGRFLVKEGVIKIHEWDKTTASFMSIDGRRYIVNSEPGVVYNAMIWLEKKTDNLAIELLINYENTRIIQLQGQIENHINKIEIIKNGIK